MLVVGTKGKTYVHLSYEFLVYFMFLFTIISYRFHRGSKLNWMEAVRDTISQYLCSKDFTSSVEMEINLILDIGASIHIFITVFKVFKNPILSSILMCV